MITGTSRTIMRGLGMCEQRETVRVRVPEKWERTTTHNAGRDEVLSRLGISVPHGAAVEWRISEVAGTQKLVVTVTERGR